MNFRFKEKRIGSAREVSKLMTSLFKETGIEDEYELLFIRRNWTEIAGEILSTHSFPAKIYGRTLLLYTDHSVFSNDIIMIKDSIIKKICSTCKGIRVDDIKVEISKKIKWGS
jgi:hypothetical protein